MRKSTPNAHGFESPGHGSRPRHTTLRNSRLSGRERAGTVRGRPGRSSASSERFDRAGAPVWAAVQTKLRPLFDPGPAGGAALVALPRGPIEETRRGCHVEVAFGASHSSSTGVPRDFRSVGCVFTIRTIGPWAGELPVLVTMGDAGLHLRAHAREPMQGICAVRETGWKRTFPGRAFGLTGTLYTTDKNFSRFDDLRIVNPIA